MRVIEYARSFLGTPYLWAGSSPQGWDCSGFIQEVLSFAGVDPKGDQTAQALLNHFIIHGKKEIGAGSLCFYGKDKASITHVSMMTSDFTIIEAGGGNELCTDLKVSANKGAFVRERPVTHRSDLVLTLRPNYPSWVYEE